MGGHGGDHHGERHAGYGWLFVCVVGMISSLTLYGITLEYVTSGGRQLHEVSYLFVTTSIYALTAYVARWQLGEEITAISKYQMLTLSMTSLASTYTSVRSLRYVIYPVQVLFKSCKPVPVMAFGVCLGKQYPFHKYVNVAIITSGVALFMAGGKSATHEGMGGDTMLLGALMLSVSLCFDGATGAYEDKLMAKDHVGPFDLMFNIQFGKAVISFIVLVAINELGSFINTVQDGGIMLFVLGLTGALGQIFVFLTINKFGALNCALIGLFRKILSLLLSFILYGHSVNGVQTVGLGLALSAMIANFYQKGGGKKHGKPAEPPEDEDEENDNRPLLSPEQELDGEEDPEDTSCGVEMTDSSTKKTADAEELIPYSEYADAMRSKQSGVLPAEQNAV